MERLSTLDTITVAFIFLASLLGSRWLLLQGCDLGVLSYFARATDGGTQSWVERAGGASGFRLSNSVW
jgi:hypothetical protein